MLLPVRTVAPATAPVTVAEAKAFCRIDHADEDALIEGLIASATDRLDGYGRYLGRALINQTWKINLEDWPCEKLRIPLAPVVSVTSLKYWDDETPSVQQTLAASNYALYEDEKGPYLSWTEDSDLPSLYSREDALELIFVAGYGAAATAIPGGIKMGLLHIIAHWYDTRAAVSFGETPSEIPLSADTLLHLYRRLGV